MIVTMNGSQAVNSNYIFSYVCSYGIIWKAVKQNALAGMVKKEETDLDTYKTKRYAYTYEDYENDKGAAELIKEIMEDPELDSLTEVVVGSWGNAWEENCQELLNGITEHADCFSHIEKLFIGDMDFEDCEVSWIMQGDYSKLWAALPNLKELAIQGSTDLELGEICHEKLESLEIICGGLPKNVIASIRDAKLPNLKKLLLYIGIEDYGFDGDTDTIKELLEKSDFPNLTYLGIVDSEIQDEITEIVLNSKYMNQIEVLDLSNGTLTDKGGELLLENLPKYPNVKELDAHYNYLSDEMVEKLNQLSITTDVSENNEVEEYDGEIYMYPMMTE